MFRPRIDQLKNEKNILFLRKLFLETSYKLNDKSNIPYTLSDEDHKDGYRSLFKLYMETEDPTEVKFAERYLTGQKHWDYLCQSEWFKPFVSRWRKELEAKLKSNAFEIVKIISKDDSHKNQFEAIKMIMNASWKPKDSEQGSKRGRPSKEEIASKLKDEVKEKAMLEEDLERIEEYL